MRLLLDTHVLLWFLREPGRIHPDVLERIEIAAENALVNYASLWEIAIKASLKKLKLPDDYQTMFPNIVTRSRLGLLPIEAGHIALLHHLDWHHKDPFDRMLIAQAKHERLTIISADAAMAKYDVEVLW